ncbi:MAG: alpha/beta fold hydrolase [Cephaloticoccus sp.]|nr:alpha/beta fold hydrolase [Cephaloticoccus sp.]MCF7759968.1 alpha/beta fold hydrolase [Cephaloticoccus sp.]
MHNLPRARILVIWLCLCLAGSLVWAATPTVEDFFRKPLLGQPRLSPDGRHLVYSMNKEKDDYAVVLLDLATMQSKTFMLAGRSSHPLLWLDNDRLILTSERNGYSYYSIKAGRATKFNDEDWNMRISEARYDRPGLLNVWFLQGDNNSRNGPAVIRPDKDKPQISGQANERYNVVEWIALPPGEPHRIISDWRGRVRGAITYDKGDHKLYYYHRVTEDAPWTRLAIDGHDDEFAGFDPAPGKIYVTHRAEKEPTAGIYAYDIETQSYGAKLFGDAEFSMIGARLDFDPQDGSIQGVHYTNDGPAVHWFTAAMQSVQAKIDAKLPGRINQLVDSDLAQTRFVVASMADRLPVRYYLYNKDKEHLAALPETYPWLNEVPLQPMQVIHYQARDGLRLQGYLTMPPQNPKMGKPPLVVLAHGGPWVRDVWGFNPEVQFLASRGYAVFQPNFRGSAGFTQAISKAQEFDFKAMHDDVTDGVQLLIRSGLINPQRIAIMGASFGGYLALSGAAFEPDLYQCAVTIVGVFDWEMIIKQRRGNRYDRFNYDILMEKLGDPGKLREKYDAISPLRHTGNIHIPVYISAGEEDATVDADQSKKLAKALKDQGVTVEEFFPEVEGHGYFKIKNRLRLYQEIDAFLAKHL